MTTYTIQSECGILDIEAESVKSAKERYERERNYNFDAVAETEGSWYSISADGVRIEADDEDMPN